MAKQQSRFDPMLVKGVGLASVVFFGVSEIYGIKKMFDNTLGLTIDDNGIFDTSTTLKYNFKDLEKLIKERFEQHRNTKHENQ